MAAVGAVLLQAGDVVSYSIVESSLLFRKRRCRIGYPPRGNSSQVGFGLMGLRLYRVPLLTS
jgi:hypothetical protein